MERLSNGPHRVLLCRVPSGDKIFSRFKKANGKLGFWKCQNRFSNTIKWKDGQMDPIGFCFAESLRGIKHFQDLKKAARKMWFWKSQIPFSDHNKMERIKMNPMILKRRITAPETKGPNTLSWHNKMERLSNGPHWALLCRVPLRDITFSRFQNGEFPPVNWKCQTPFSNHNKMERVSNGPHWALLCRVPSGDKTFF